MRNFLEFKMLHSKTRSATRPTRTAPCAVLRWCPGTRATGRATPGFHAWLDRRVAAPAAALSSGVALPVARMVARAVHANGSTRVTLRVYFVAITPAIVGLPSGAVRAWRVAPPAGAASALTALEGNPDWHLRDGHHADGRAIQARSESRLSQDQSRITLRVHERTNGSTKQSEDDGMNDERIRNMKTAGDER
jgi:hypothetical protein